MIAALLLMAGLIPPLDDCLFVAGTSVVDRVARLPRPVRVAIKRDVPNMKEGDCNLGDAKGPPDSCFQRGAGRDGIWVVQYVQGGIMLRQHTLVYRVHGAGAKLLKDDPGRCSASRALDPMHSPYR